MRSGQGLGVQNLIDSDVTSSAERSGVHVPFPPGDQGQDIGAAAALASIDEQFPTLYMITVQVSRYREHLTSLFLGPAHHAAEFQRRFSRRRAAFWLVTTPLRELRATATLSDQEY